MENLNQTFSRKQSLTVYDLHILRITIVTFYAVNVLQMNKFAVSCLS